MKKKLKSITSHSQNFTKPPSSPTTTLLPPKERKIRKLQPPIESNKNPQSKKKQSDTKFQTDSGFESFNYSVNPIKLSKMSLDGIVPVNEPVSVPFDVSFVGGVFSFKLYHIEVRLLCS